MSKQAAGYSSIQIGLHWAVVVLVAFQYVAHKEIEAAWTATQNGALPDPADQIPTYLHIGAGSLILALALLRIALRLTRGAPSPPADEPRLLQLLSETVHYGIYALLLLLPLTGIAAWFVPLAVAASAHVLLQDALLIAIVLHVAGALFQHFVRRSQVLMRMLTPEEATSPPQAPPHAARKA